MRYQSRGALLLFFLAWAGCGDDSEGTGGSGNSTGEGAGTPKSQYVIDVVVDANRNGVADAADPGDQDAEETWNATAGAMFLPNLDDDDGDGVRDADDGIVNAGEDIYDLVSASITACPECPDGSIGRIELDAEGAKNVRVYALDASLTSWRLIAGETSTCNEEVPQCTPQVSYDLTTDEVRAGLTLAIEGRDVMRDPAGWNGYLDITYSLLDESGAALTSEANPEGVDKARLRVAPWQLFGNLSPFDRVWSSKTSAVFVAGVKAGADNAGVEHKTYSNYGDQWTQDFFQTGFFAIPSRDANGNPIIHGMTVANARPWGRNNSDSSLPITWLNKNYLGPNRATLVVYENKHSGDSFDSHGNHDLIPAYTNGGTSFPLGRILYGSGVLDETKAFYEAQLLQAPAMVVDTNWLLVGHVDEYLSYVPAATPRGWKLLVGSPDLARQMLLEAQSNGNGSTMLHVGKVWYTDTGTAPADISIDDVLADPVLLEASQNAQASIDGEVARLQDEIGLADDEIIEMPFLFNQVQYGPDTYNIAYQPGTVNALVMGDTIVIPKPFGPQIGGEDIFEADLEERLGTAVNQLGADGQGLDVFFADDWDVYHRLDGEVHCGTNPEAPAPFSSVNWWETGR